MLQINPLVERAFHGRSWDWRRASFALWVKTVPARMSSCSVSRPMFCTLLFELTWADSELRC
eukprot:4312703-Alexandrium_andersonii.AAC.1